jgi:hypothetical protein
MEHTVPISPRHSARLLELFFSTRCSTLIWFGSPIFLNPSSTLNNACILETFAMCVIEAGCLVLAFFYGHSYVARCRLQPIPRLCESKAHTQDQDTQSWLTMDY